MSSASGLLGSGYIFSVLAGALSAVILCMLLGGILTVRTVRVQEELASIVSGRSPSMFAQNGARLLPKPTEIRFAAFNAVEGAPPVSEDAPAEEAARSIDQFSLVGTLPDIGAWVNVDNATSLVLREQEFKGYVLDDIDPGEVSFSREGETYPLYLTFFDNRSAAAPPPPPPVAEAPPATAESQAGAMVAAEFNGSEGTVARELLNEMLMNPMDELRKIRLVPNESGGMTVRSIRPDSILAQLGVKRGDVLTGINDIPIKGATDLVNVINSMMSSSRFDASVLRGQEEGRLSYVVR
ncbi:MAG: PDZ domain-containing protein [Synergistaceae bacterium]|jgi:membrane-associated protease RseP (regulator of RpoE activity)|nr:PDZ domain-containing protein [Synergistaceae bacterium]